MLLHLFAYFDAESLRNIMSVADTRFQRIAVGQCRRMFDQLNSSFTQWLQPNIGSLDTEVWRSCERSRYHDLLLTFVSAPEIFCTKPKTITDFGVAWPLVRQFGQPTGHENGHSLLGRLKHIAEQPCDELRLNGYRDTVIETMNFLFGVCINLPELEDTFYMEPTRKWDFCPQLRDIEFLWFRKFWTTETEPLWQVKRMRRIGHPIGIQAVCTAVDNQLMGNLYKHHSMLQTLMLDNTHMEFRCMNMAVLVEEILPLYKKLIFLYVTNVSAGDLMVLLAFVHRTNRIEYLRVMGFEADGAYQTNAAQRAQPDVLDTAKLVGPMESLQVIVFEYCQYLTVHFLKSLLRHAPNMVVMDVSHTVNITARGLRDLEGDVAQQRQHLVRVEAAKPFYVKAKQCVCQDYDSAAIDLWSFLLKVAVGFIIFLCIKFCLDRYS